VHQFGDKPRLKFTHSLTSAKFWLFFPTIRSQLWKVWDSHGSEFKDHDLGGEGVEFITQTHNYPAHDTSFQKKGIYIRCGTPSVKLSNAHKFHHRKLHKFLYLLDYTKPIPIAARSKAWVCGRSLAEIVVSNTTGRMDVCMLW